MSNPPEQAGDEPSASLDERVDEALRDLWGGRDDAFNKLVDGEEKGSGGTGELLRGVVSGASNQHRERMPVDRIGQYRILREIGRGGMGVVYEAEQESPHRSVALKLIRGSRHVSEQHIRLFQREIETLARLSHPGIASIHDAGCTDDGEHFFTMELVRGVPFLEFVAGRQTDTQVAALSITQRLDLFLKVCEAIGYAHQRGVIHRDLKPSNILVDATGNPKILDFGLARITDADVAATTIVTEPGRMVGTLAYMSPEQARGQVDEIDVRSDVYSLGVILYQMLAGQLPFKLSPSSLHEAVRSICETVPPTPQHVNATLPSDLSTIVMKSLEKEPAQRYSGPLPLADDIRRYMSGQPIVAHPPTLAYQFRKLVARHKAPSALIAMLIVMVGAFAVWMSLLYRTTEAQRTLAESNLVRANEAESQARTAAEQAGRISGFLQNMLGSVAPEVARGRDTTILRDLLEESSRRVETDLADEPEIAATVQNTIGNTYRSLGLYDEAETHLRAALALREQARGEDDTDVAESLNNLAVLLKRKGELSEAERLYRRALGINRKNLGESHPRLAVDLNNLASLVKAKGNYRSAESLYLDALRMSRRIHGAEHVDVARTLHNLAGVLKAKGDNAAAIEPCREALAIHRTLLGEDHPRVADNMVSLATLLLASGDYAESESLCRTALAVQRKVVGDKHPRLARTLNVLSRTLAKTGYYDEAEAMCRQALEIRRAVLGHRHASVASTLDTLAELLSDRGDFAAAEAAAREALDIRQSTAGDDHPATISSMNTLAVVLRSAGRFDEATDWSIRALNTVSGRYGADHWRTAVQRSAHGDILLSSMKYAEAENELTAADTVLRATFGDLDERTQNVLEKLVDFFTLRDMPARAEEYRNRLKRPGEEIPADGN